MLLCKFNVEVLHIIKKNIWEDFFIQNQEKQFHMLNFDELRNKINEIAAWNQPFSFH